MAQPRHRVLVSFAHERLTPRREKHADGIVSSLDPLHKFLEVSGITLMFSWGFLVFGKRAVSAGIVTTA
jgi:hypothetical protein